MNTTYYTRQRELIESLKWNATTRPVWIHESEQVLTEVLQLHYVYRELLARKDGTLWYFLWSMDINNVPEGWTQAPPNHFVAP